jgi:transaldolase
MSERSERGPSGPRSGEPMSASPIARLIDHGQSPWYDNLTRELVRGGGLQRLVDEHGIRGVTSNPTIFEKAIGAGGAYDADLARLVGAGREIEAAYWELVVDDIRAACDVLAPTYEVTDAHDGYVSVEVSPELAHDTDATLDQVRWLWNEVGKPNVMIKIPATLAGVPAIEAALAEGINVNVTLIFGLDRYAAVMGAHQRGIARVVDGGGDPSRLASVASFFVSRVDTEVDRRLPDGHPLRGKAAIANAQLAYQLFLERYSGGDWTACTAAGAQVQRPLWASTSTKNPAYPDTYYVDALVGRDTVDTLAPASIEALADHGDPQPDTIEHDVEGARATFVALAEAGVDVDDVTATLEREGVASFAASYRDVLDTLGKKARELGASS